MLQYSTVNREHPIWVSKRGHSTSRAARRVGSFSRAGQQSRPLAAGAWTPGGMAGAQRGLARAARTPPRGIGAV
jgi:hypothetical protein